MNEFRIDATVEDAIEILIDRTLDNVPPPKHVVNWREQVRANLHAQHDRHAFALLSEDAESAITPKVLADLLTSAPLPPKVPPMVEPATLYAQAEQRRREWNALQPDGWIDPDAFERCIGAARAALAAREVRS
jgi:hypothetical protein